MPDVMVAAIAINQKLPVVTGNVAHYETIRDIGYALRVENWRAKVLRIGDSGTVSNFSNATSLTVPFLSSRAAQLRRLPSRFHVRRFDDQHRLQRSSQLLGPLTVFGLNEEVSHQFGIVGAGMERS
jgi:hypothetical protein